MPDADRRHQPRYTAGLDSRINFSPSRILDLSFVGALMETREWLSLGHRCTLRVADPPIQIPARVVRCRLVRVDPGDGRPIYEAGLSFDAAPTLRLQLVGLVGTLCRDRVEAPMHAGF
jgi:hypothetical protein